MILHPESLVLVKPELGRPGINSQSLGLTYPRSNSTEENLQKIFYRLIHKAIMISKRRAVISMLTNLISFSGILQQIGY